MHPFFCRVFLFLAFLLITNSCYTQQYNFKTYNAKDGLTGSAVNDIQQDKLGYLWFATQEGAARFDGKSFRIFSKKDGLIGNNVLDICLDNTGNVWIATDEGVSRYNGVSFANYTVANGLSDNYVYSIYCDRHGFLWFATWHGGVSCFDGKNFTNLTTKDGLPGNFILSILEDRSGIFWFGTGDTGLVSYNPERKNSPEAFHLFTTKDGLSANGIFSLLQDRNGKLWIGTFGGGICSYDGRTFSKPADDDPLKKDVVSRILEDKRGNLWFATDRNGLLKIQSGKRKYLTEKEGLISNNISAVFEDYEGNIWAGGFAGSACILKSEAFVTYGEKEGLKQKNTTCITSDNHGNLVVGTLNGLFIFNQTSSSFTEVPELTKSNITSVFCDSRGMIWAGTNFLGMYCIGHKQQGYVVDHIIKRLGDYEYPLIVKTCEDKKGNIWMGSFNAGLFCIRADHTISHYDTTNGLSSNSITTLLLDKGQNLWIATASKGLMKYDGIRFTYYTTKNGLPENGVYALAEDKAEVLYAGSPTSGFTSITRGGINSYSEKDGLGSNSVYALLCDGQSRIWIGTNKGLERMETRKDSNSTTLEFRKYNDQQGFSGSMINSEALYKDVLGNIWLGTPDGLFRYTPSLDYPNTVPPKIDLSDIKLFNETVNWKTLTDKTDARTGLPVNPDISFRNNYISFQFRAFTTGIPLYRYKLEGLDDRWSPAREFNEAVYPSIPPGTYTLKVVACNNDGVWTPQPLTFSFRILPPWYRTWVFYGICLLLLLVGIFAFISFRTRKLRKEKEILEKTVTERTAEVVKQKQEIEHKNHEITDSINYAKRLQTAILPPDKLIKESLPDSFILFKPKDIVSGDFYWMEQVGDKVLFAAVDCTGHGVPGAMVSVIGHNSLNRTVKEFGLTQPAAILDKLTQLVEETFSKSESEVKDGMDISLCCLNLSTHTLEWAGANNPLWVWTEGKMEEFKADKQPIGKFDYRKPFTNHTISLKQGDTIYIYTDGYADQFGGPKGKKFKYKQLEDVIRGMTILNMQEQCITLNLAYEEWKGELEQIDDVCVIGVRV